MPGPSWSSALDNDGEAPAYSDWCVVFHHDDHNDVEFYVHKVFLGSQSGYFSALFDSNKFKEGDEGRSIVDFSSLQPEAFDGILAAFKILLDDFYHIKPMDLKTETEAVAVSCLCSYLQIDDIGSLAEKYMNSRLNSVKAAIYYRSIKMYRDFFDVQVPNEIVAAFCSNHPGVFFDRSMIMEADMILMRKVAQEVTKLEGRTQFDSGSLSRTIAHFLSKSEAQDDTPGSCKEDFELLTNENVLPSVDSKAALLMLRQEKTHGLAVLEDGEITNLQNRCATSLLENDWEELDETPNFLDITTPQVMNRLLTETIDITRKQRDKFSRYENRGKDLLAVLLQIDQQVRRDPPYEYYRNLQDEVDFYKGILSEARNLIDGAVLSHADLLQSD